jgi:ribosomal-protein-alanine N-acetyltransferase
MPHVVLRPFCQEDAAELLEIFRHPDVRRYLLDGFVVSAEWLRQEISSSEQRFARGSAGLWAIRRPGDELIVGFVGFREFFEPPQLQLLYGLLPQYWHCGLATAAATAACEHAFAALHFDVIQAATDRPNTASIDVLTRLGLRAVRESDDGPAGTVFFSITREQWRRPVPTSTAASSPQT